MVNSQLGSNFHRRSGGDERRGVFSRLPPLSIPNSLRRLTTNSPKRSDSNSSPSLKSSTSSAIIGIGSVLALVPSSKKSADSLQQKRPATASTATTATPSSSLPLSAFSPPQSSRNSADTQITTPGSGSRGPIDFGLRPGILPDASPGKTYFPVVSQLPDSTAQMVSWEERRYSSIHRQHGSEGGPVLVETSSKPSNGSVPSNRPVPVDVTRKPSSKPSNGPVVVQNSSRPSNGPPFPPRIMDVSLNRVDVDESQQDAEIAMQHLEQLKLCEMGPKDKSSPQIVKPKDSAQAPRISWDPGNVGHDTWNESGKDERWQQRNQLFSNLSAFNLRGAQKRKSGQPKQDVGPIGEAISPDTDPDNDPLTPRDVGGLVQNKDYFSAADTKLLRSKAISPVNTPPSASFPIFAEEAGYSAETFSPPKVTVSVPNQTKPRIAVAMPTNTAKKNARQQSLFDLSGSSGDSSEDSGDDELSSLPNTIDAEISDNEISISIKSRTARDSTRASLLRRTSSTPARSRGESIGLADCSRDPMVLAAGFEKGYRGNKNRGLTVSGGEGSAGGNRRECYVYRSSGNVGKEVWEVCPGREALGVERKRSRKGKGKGRNRGETV